MIFIIFLIASLGVCYAWNDTEASRPFRNFVARIPYIRKPMLCHECSSFWISLILTLFINPLEDLTFPVCGNIISAFCGFFVNLYFVRNNLVSLNND